MSDQGDDGPGRGGGGDRPPDEDARIGAFSEAIGDPAEICRRGATMSVEEEAEYMRLADEDEDYLAEIGEELQSWRDEGVLVDGAAEGVATGKSVRVRVPAGRAPAVPSPDPETAGGSVEAAPPATAAPGRAEPPSPPGDPEGGVAAGTAADPAGPDRARFLELTDALLAAMRVLGKAVDQGIADIKADMPRLREGEFGELAKSVRQLEELLRLQESDGARRREVGRRRWRWPLRGLAVAALVGMFAGGAVLQARLPVLDDGTNGWKDIVWDRHGMKIAECIDRADKRGGGAKCGVRVEVR